jgi:hypothetical protein
VRPYCSWLLSLWADPPRASACLACTSGLLAEASRLHHLGRKPEQPESGRRRELRALSVRARDLGIGRRGGKPHGCFAIRADLPGVAGLLSGRTLVAGMVNSTRMRPEVRLCAQTFPAFWVLWHHLGTGVWWTAGFSRRLPTTAPACPFWVTHPDVSVGNARGYV